MQFFDILTSKKGPELVCFVHFDLQMCFAPHRRAIFPHPNFKKMVPSWCVLCILTCKCASRYSGVPFFVIATSKNGPMPSIFFTFWLENALRATAACLFPCLLWTATSAPAALASLLLDPRETQIIGKTEHFATFLTFCAAVSSFYWLYFLLTLLLCSAFHLSILSEVS